MTSIVLRAETSADVAAREALLDAAFGPTRALKTCERLREGRQAADGLSFVAMDGDTLVGTLRLWHVMAGPGTHALMLGPLAVAETHRSHGVGKKLIFEALWRAVCRGHKAVVLVGDASYYNRFGFSRDLTLGLDLPGPFEEGRFLGLELEEGALKGATGLVMATGPRASTAQVEKVKKVAKQWAEPVLSSPLPTPLPDFALAA